MQHDRGRKYEVDVKTREEITSLIAHHVTAVNYIYRNTKFDGRTEHRNIRFEVSLPPHNNLCCLSPAHCNHSIESCPTQPVSLVPTMRDPNKACCVVGPVQAEGETARQGQSSCLSHAQHSQLCAKSGEI